MDVYCNIDNQLFSHARGVVKSQFYCETTSSTCHLPQSVSAIHPSFVANIYNLYIDRPAIIHV